MDDLKFEVFRPKAMAKKGTHIRSEGLVTVEVLFTDTIQLLTEGGVFYTRGPWTLTPE